MDREDRRTKADAAKELALDLYEAKIKDKIITASEMAVYLKLLSQLGLEGVAAPAGPKRPDLPSFEDDEDDGPIRFQANR